MNVEKFDTQKAKGIITIVVVVAVVVIVFAFGKNIVDFINGLFGKDDPDAKAARDALKNYDYKSSNPNSPFSPKVYDNKPSSANIIPVNTAFSIVTDVYESVGPLYWMGIGIDALKAYSAIQKCNSQADVSFVSKLFTSNYQSDMYDYMTRYFTSSKDVIVMNQILNFVTNLPVY